MPSVSFVVETLESRLRKGDYRVKSFPANRRLAEELGVSRQTIHKAVQQLVADGRLAQTPNGRISTAPRHQTATKHLAIITPSFPEAILIDLYNAIKTIIVGEDWEVKAVHYSHWHDPVISDAVRGMDGVFFLPFAEDFPADIIRLLQSAGKVIVIERDLSSHGLPSLQFLPPRSVENLLEESGSAGRGPVACLNTQPTDAAIRARIDHWRLWAALHRVEGPLFDHPVLATCSAADHARQVFRGLLQDGRLEGVRTLFCTTTAAAFGAMRAMADFGLRPGVDLAVCSADSGFGAAQNYIPSLTCLYNPPMEPFVRFCLDWIAAPDQAWPGTLLMQPTDVPVFLGESTGQGDPTLPLSAERQVGGAVKAASAPADARRPRGRGSRPNPAPRSTR